MSGENQGPSKSPCEQALASLYMFLDRELIGPDLVEVQSHIDDCMHCVEAFEFEAELRTVIASKCREQVPTELVERIRISIRSAHLEDS